MKTSIKALILYIVAFTEGCILVSTGEILNIIFSVLAFMCCFWAGYLTVKYNKIEMESLENGEKTN